MATTTAKPRLLKLATHLKDNISLRFKHPKTVFFTAFIGALSAHNASSPSLFPSLPPTTNVDERHFLLNYSRLNIVLNGLVTHFFHCHLV